MDGPYTMRLDLTPFILVTTFLLLPLGFTKAQNPVACYEQKNKKCLEGIFKDIVTNPAPDKLDAIYYLGLLYEEQGDFEEARTHFEAGVVYGDGTRSREKVAELLKSGKVKLDTTDCLSLETGVEKCLLNVAESIPKKAPAAFYLIGQHLAESDPERGIEYTIKAAEAGHRTSECLLASGFAQETAYGPASGIVGFKAHLAKDFEKSRYWGAKCVSGPFAGFRKKHFEKYKQARGHKAYAKSGHKHHTFAEDAATPELAAMLAGTLCELGVELKKLDNDCLVVNVDGEWVDFFKPQSLPERLGGVDDLLLTSARDSYKKKFANESAPKVFVQGPLGNWGWRSGNPGTDTDDLARTAVQTCQKDWRYKKFDSACKVVNVDGKWVQQ